MAYSERYNAYIRNKPLIASRTRKALLALSQENVPTFEEYTALCRAPSNSRSYAPAPPKQVEEELRREYRSQYGGSHSLSEYRTMMRDAVSQYVQNDPILVMHRRGDLDVVTQRKPQEDALDRVWNRHAVAVAVERQARRTGEMEPYGYQGTPGRQKARDNDQFEKETQGKIYGEGDFEKVFGNLRKADPSWEPNGELHHSRDHRGVRAFDIPPNNRTGDIHRVREFGKHPKLTGEEPREIVSRTRGMYRGKEIRKIPKAEMPPANQHFGFF